MHAKDDRTTTYAARVPGSTLIAGAVLALLLAACGGGTDVGTEAPGTPTGDTTATQETADDDMDMDDDETMDMDDDMAMGGTFGEPADASEADRAIEVNVDNDLAFEPAEFEVGVGEVITFVISNTGDVEHEFVLGDEEAQNEMAQMMDSGEDHAHSGEMSNAVTIHAGETAELTWRFTEPGTVLIGCHVPGHWEADMRGSVTVG